MKKALHYYFLYLVTMSFLVVSSCDNKQPELQISNKEHMDAGFKIIEQMKAAYKSEKTTIAKYEAHSKKAEEEGYHNVALLFNAIAASEYIHATNHKLVIEDAGNSVDVITPVFLIKTTKENLSDDIKDEGEKTNTMYPDFLKTAVLADNQIAYLSISYAMKTALKHKFFFEQALGDINSNTLNSLPPKYYVCPACGNTYTNPPKHCDFSLTGREQFIVFQ